MGFKATTEENVRTSDYDPEDRIYTYSQLKCLNMLVHPIWIFDSVERRMRWANDPGLEMWNAESLEELQARDFKDVSASSAKRMEDYLEKIEQGLNIPDQWTLYPKGKAKTVQVNVTAIKFRDEDAKVDDHFSLFCEGIPLAKQELVNETIRSVEIIRHLPVAVMQFNLNGQVMFSNPEASRHLSAETVSASDSRGDQESVESSGSSTQEDQSASSSSQKLDTPIADSQPTRRKRKRNGDLVKRFANEEVGRKALRQIQQEDQSEVDLEALLQTTGGPKWSSIQLRKSHDPVTSELVILFSAIDKTDAVQAKKERQARKENSEFLAIMAHEIRTPLHQVTGFVDLLGQTTLNAEQQSFVSLLKTSAQGLMTVISDVLDFSKLEAGKMKLESIPFEPLTVVQGAIQAVRNSCDEKGLFLNLEWNKEIPFKLLGDPNRLRQILLNLLSNAVKFTHTGGITVKIEAVCVEDVLGGNSDRDQNQTGYVKYIVSDTGIGISPEHKDLIFQKYQQATVAVARNFGGTGLGLSICQLLVERMEGFIGLDSTLNQGTSFWIQIPIRLPQDSVTKEGGDEAMLSLNQNALNILIVEDNKVNQKLLSKMLSRLGHQFEIAQNGREAVDFVVQNPNLYDLVLMDVQMPVMDGLEATRRLRALGFKDLKIYGLTASMSRSDFAELGFDDWLPKPILMKDLKLKLDQVYFGKRGPPNPSEVVSHYVTKHYRINP